MLNTEPLGGERVPFYDIVFCSITEKNNWEWELESKTEGVNVL
jgi:hypothetical protein